MKILLVTPLYPPDIAGPVPYVKELASRLKEEHEVTILAYNHIPEKIPGVPIHTVEKRLPTVIRIVLFTFLFIKESTGKDCIHIQNGPSTELPFVLVSYLRSQNTLFRVSDGNGIKQSLMNVFRSYILRKAIERAKRVITHPDIEALLPRNILHPIEVMPSPQMCPEILPFTEKEERVQMAYEASWKEHIQRIT